MNYTDFKLVLTDEELQLPALEELRDKFRDWLSFTKESEGGRKTRSANKKADKIYEEIMGFKLPPIRINNHVKNAEIQYIENNHNNISRDVSMDCTQNSDSGDSSSSRPVTRSLRPRYRTPSPSTPQNQRLRSHMKQQESSNTSTSGSSSSNVLVAALNQQHPSVSVTKIRQLLRADSAQKKREQEQERQQRILSERKVKEERAEAQKKLLLEQRAVTAKQKREHRLMQVAEVRKAREQAKSQKRKPQPQQPSPSPQQKRPPQPPQQSPARPPPSAPQPAAKQPEKQGQKSEMKKSAEPVVLNETFQKNEVNNIEIIIADTSNSVKGGAHNVAAWARAPHFREPLIEQYANHAVKLPFKSVNQIPVDLESVFGKSINSRHLHRTSSAVWTPPRKSPRRSNSMVSTPSK